MAALLLAASSTISPYAELYADGRDPHSLFSPKLLNRQLHLQLKEEPSRLSHRVGSEWFSFAVDFTMGTQLPPGQQTRFHGFFVSDGYVELRPVEGVELDLNLVMLNISASDGYRFSTYLFPGAALHLYVDAFDIDGIPLRIDFLGPDLDLVTIGKGLLLEQTPLEGEQISLTWGDIELRHVFGGKIFWPDNLVTAALDFFQGSAGILYSLWFSDSNFFDPQSSLGFRPFGDRDPYTSHHLGVYGSYEVLPELTLTGEYSAKLFEGTPKSGLLLRADWSGELFEDCQAHLGYQFRYYQRGFGPNVNLNETTTSPILPYREQVYATNSFEYFGVSKYFDQWSHSMMAELEYRPWEHVVLTAAVEYFFRAASDPEVHDKIIIHPLYGRLPGITELTYYRLGFEVYPWAEEQHHLSFLFTNKLVSLISGRPIDDSPALFTASPLLLILAEVEL